MEAIKNLFLLFLSTCSVAVSAQSDYVVSDYPFGITLPESEIEIMTSYVAMNDTVDIFNFKSSRSDDIDSSFQSASLGDYEGIHLAANYGLFSDWLLSGEYNFRKLNITFGNYLIDNLEFSVTKNFKLSQKNFVDYCFVNTGIKINYAADYNASSMNELNYFAKKIDPNVSVYTEGGQLYFTDGTLTYKPSMVENGRLKDPLTVSIVDSSDTTIYIRGGIGRQFKYIHTALFAEYGSTNINGKIDNNLDEYGLDNRINRIDELSQSFDRTESYLKAGINIYHKSDLGICTNLSYYYLSIGRGRDLDYIDYNHVIDADLSIWIYKGIALNIGAEYFNRQFAGVVPFLYNRYTQTSFDHDYGIVDIGLVIKL
ncbi:MAG: hypothetical protein D6B27_05310 [Gammaproteobacteria bacterium]|nr:MAG: hypothetical protein D6B27_05310 [Gammaproteobacteria bacterium]